MDESQQIAQERQARRATIVTQVKNAVNPNHADSSSDRENSQDEVND